LSSTAAVPRTLTIGAGDTVRWTFPASEPHTFTFDNGHQPPLFQEGFTPAPDGSGDFDITPLALPRPADGNHGVFDATIQINSGIPSEPPDQRRPFTLAFNTAGVYTYICAVHGPAMTALITVVPSGSALSETPDQAQSRAKAELGFATGVAHSGLTQIPVASAPTPLSNATLFPVVAGTQPGPGIAALAFSPGNLTVHRGDAVLFSMADFQEIHTVTFLSGAAAPPAFDVAPQPAGPPKIVIRGSTSLPAGGNVYAGSGILNSGMLFPGTTVTVTFNAPPGTYEYRCLFHGDAPQNMRGTITVVERHGAQEYAAHCRGEAGMIRLRLCLAGNRNFLVG
jgi:plastocyanin